VVQFGELQPWMFSGGEVSSSTMIDPAGILDWSMVQVGTFGVGKAGSVEPAPTR